MESSRINNDARLDFNGIPPQAPSAVISPQSGNADKQDPRCASYEVSAISNRMSDVNSSSPPPAWNSPPLYQRYSYGNKYQV